MVAPKTIGESLGIDKTDTLLNELRSKERQYELLSEFLVKSTTKTLLNSKKARKIINELHRLKTRIDQISNLPYLDVAKKRKIGYKTKQSKLNRMSF